MPSTKKIAAVTGANRGIGLGVAKELAKNGFHVLLLGRNVDALKKAQKEIQGETSVFPLDVADEKSVEKFQEWLTKEIGRIDAFINCAGVFLDSKAGTFSDASVLQIE